MQPTFHATRPTPHGASCLVQAMSAWSVKTRRAPSRHCGDARVYGHTTTIMHGMSTRTPPPCFPEKNENTFRSHCKAARPSYGRTAPPHGVLSVSKAILAPSDTQLYLFAARSIWGVSSSLACPSNAWIIPQGKSIQSVSQPDISYFRPPFYSRNKRYR